MSAPFLRISHSSRGLLHSCARKFEFQKMYEHPKNDESIAAEAGNALHRGFQHYLVHRDEERAIVEFALNYPLHLCDNPMHDRSLEACYYTLEAMISEASMWQYDLATVNCLDGVVRPAVEVPFEIELVNYSLVDGQQYTVFYTGYIDAIFFDRATGEYVVVDIKTTQRKLNDFNPVYEFSEQCVPYGLVLEYMLGKEIRGFEVKYFSCNIDVLNPDVRMYPYHKSSQDIEDWFRGLLMDLAQLKLFIAMDWFPRNGGGSSCLAFNRPCYFFDICRERNKEIIQQIVLNGKEEAKRAVDEAVWSKSGREEWKPWVKFKLEVP